MAEAVLPVTYASVSGAALGVREATPPPSRPPRLLDRVRQAIRTRHYSQWTEKAYVASTRRYIPFHAKRHPSDPRWARPT